MEDKRKREKVISERAEKEQRDKKTSLKEKVKDKIDKSLISESEWK